MREFLELVQTANFYALYYDPHQDSLTHDIVVCWGLIKEDGSTRIEGLVLDKESGCLMPASDYCNFVGTLNSTDYKNSELTKKLAEKGKAMREWLLEEQP